MKKFKDWLTSPNKQVYHTLYLKRVTTEVTAWKTGHRPGTTPQQWAMARVNSMLTGGKADPDLQPKAKTQRKQRRHQKSQKSLVVFKSGLNQTRQGHLIS